MQTNHEGKAASAPPVPTKRRKSRGFLTSLFTSVFVCAIALGGYHTWNESHRPPPQKIGVVDLNRIFETIQERMGSEMLREELPAEQREAIVKRYESIGEKLPLVIGQLSQRCQCVVAIRQAILTENVEDLTPALRHALEL